MVEKKIKKSESPLKTSSSATKKTTTSKRIKSSSIEKKTKSPSDKKPESKPKVKVLPKVAVKSSGEHKTFSKRNLNERKVVSSHAEKKTSTWVVLIFIFSLVFFLFSLYKVFIYKDGYAVNNPVPISLLPQHLQENRTLQQENQIGELTETQGGTILESDFVDGEIMLHDAQVIQNFYSYLANNQIEEMNTLIDRPLKNSITRANHWNKKNIKIFTKHLSDTVLLQDIFLVPNSSNPEKKTRKYSYTLKYTINPSSAFTENWELTLITRGEETLISEIMCKTEGCSRSPFFWPQNYGLK